MKSLSGKDLAGFIKERQSKVMDWRIGRTPKLLILKDSHNPVIESYVELKRQYGSDIGVDVEIQTVPTDQMKAAVLAANDNNHVDGIIVQLPLLNPDLVDEIIAEIAPEKDVDGLVGDGSMFTSATAEAILWLLSGYNIDLEGKKIALIGKGKLVGEPLAEILRGMGLDFRIFTERNSDNLLTLLPRYDIIITATGVAGLIKADMLGSGAVVVDAGTTSENGVLKGDLDDAVRQRDDLVLTPKIGGVGPLTVAVLFEHVLQAYARSYAPQN